MSGEGSRRAVPGPPADGFRTFLALWVGLAVSLLGSTLTSFALGVQVFEQTRSATQYALVLFCGTLPPLVVLPLAGPLLDRVPRRAFLAACDLAGLAATAELALLARRGPLTLTAVCPVEVVIATAAALQTPAFSATVPRLVAREQLGRASGLLQIALAIAQLAAPVLGAALLGLVGLAGIAALDAATFLGSLAVLFAVRIPPAPASARPRAPYVRDLALGWRAIFRNAGLATLLVTFALVNFFAELASVLFAPYVLGFATPAALGAILSAGGAGFVAGGVVMAAWGGPARPARFAAWVAAASGVAVAAVGFTTSRPALAAIVAAFFFALPLVTGASQTVWQRVVPLDLQGRVFSARTTVALSMVPLATLVAGPLAEHVAEPAMRQGGRLAGVLAPWLGAGPGRGIGLIFVACGALIALVGLAASRSAPLRRLDRAADLAIAAAPVSPSR